MQQFSDRVIFYFGQLEAVNPGFQLSEIKDNSIAELLHWLDEEIIKSFYAQGRVVELEPRSPQTEEVAKKTSILAEDILFGKQNARWFRDFVDEGLLLRLGMARVDMVEERWEPVVFENKTVDDILQIMTMPDYRPKAGDKSFDISPQPDGLYSILAEQREPRRIVIRACLLYTSPSPRDRQKSRMPSSA